MINSEKISLLKSKFENKKIKIENDLISIIIPIYGNFDINRLLLTIDSIKNQKGIKFEIVVSEQGKKPRAKKIIKSDIKYIFTEADDVFSGKIRNLGINESSGEFIYTNDADIIFLNQYYLYNSKKLLKNNKKLILSRPLMRRLVIENFEIFLNKRNLIGFNNALNELDLTQDYIVTVDKIKRNWISVKKESDYEKVFTCSEQDFNRYKNNSLLKGLEPTIWKENLHAGGNFFRREQFELVGRYCEEYSNWGREDSDLQWKFSELFNLEFFPKKKEFEVIHLDHDQSYFSSKKWKNNEKIAKLRMSKGIEYAILKDLGIKIF